MKNFAMSSVDPLIKIKQAIYESMEIYVNRLIGKYYDFESEAYFQHHFSKILENVLNLKSKSLDEHYVITLEKNYPLNGCKDEVDIAIIYSCNNVKKTVLIEMKNKHNDNAIDVGLAESYKDIYELGLQIGNISGCKIDAAYFIFLTDYSGYTKKSESTTRKELPMYDGAIISSERRYTVSKQSIKGSFKKYPDGLQFYRDYKIEYTNFFVEEKPFWYFIVEI